MKSNSNIILTILLILTHISLSAYAVKGESLQVNAEIELSKTSFYSGEVVIATLFLSSIDNEIGFVKSIPMLSLEKGTFAKEILVNQINSSSITRNEKGILRKYPIAQYAISIDFEGKNKVAANKVLTGINIPTVQHHPFWGNITTYTTKEIVLEFKSVDVNVKKLPENKERIPFSGAVGNFEIKTFIPATQFVINEPNTIFIEIEGKGLLPDEILPEYTEAFGKNVQLKSISGSSQTFFNGEDLITKRTWECEIVPKSIGNNQIGTISFGYFNVVSGKYVKAESEPINIMVESSTIRRDIMDI